MNTNNSISRIAGLLYLIVIIGAIFGEFFVRSKIIVWSDATETAQNILASKGLFRLGIVVQLITEACFLLLVLTLYRLFKPVNKNYALVMVSCILVSVAMMSINTLNLLAALHLLNGTDYLMVFTTDQLYAQVMFLLNKYILGFNLASLFFGLWLFPLGYLVFKSGSGRFSKILGIWLMITCFALLINFFMLFLFPTFHRGTIFSIAYTIDLSEIVCCIWLLIKGVNVK